MSCPEERRAEIAFGYPKASAQGCPGCGYEGEGRGPRRIEVTGGGDKDWTISQV